MTKKNLPLLFILLALFSCTSQHHLAYLNNLSETGGEPVFAMNIPDYTIQYRDVLYITARAITSEGVITDLLSSSRNIGASTSYLQGEAGQYLFGFDVNREGNILIPAIGHVPVAGLTLEAARDRIQTRIDSIFINTLVECKLLSFKFTVIGEVRNPGTYINYNNYLTVLEALGRAGGINDYGRRDRLLVIRPVEGGTRTFDLNLQDKAILTNEAYFLLPNDVVIVEPESRKIFNLNLPVFAFIVSTTTSLVTTTLLLINYFGNK
jgi:polysaccharide export outer membrane protein